jgi:ferredoxin
MAILEIRDLATIEYLNEASLSSDARKYLLKLYGKNGERDNFYQWQKQAYDKCLETYSCIGCGECGSSHPFFKYSLFELVAKSIKDIESGQLFDIQITLFDFGVHHCMTDCYTALYSDEKQRNKTHRFRLENCTLCHSSTLN